MLKLILQACGNPDHEENPWDNIVDGRRIQENQKSCNTIEECQKAVRDYI